jgi:protein gp37
MSDNSKIEWTDATWNPVTGCTKVSQGCKNCYMFREYPKLAKRGVPGYAGGRPDQVRLWPDRLDQPLHWRKPRRVFVCSMADLFHEAVPIGFHAEVWNVMAKAKQHIFQILTKRPKLLLCGDWPLPNVWVGVSVEDQKTADERIPLLLQAHVALRFVSYEPALGTVNLSRFLSRKLALSEIPGGVLNDSCYEGIKEGVDWVIAGGESGPDARPSHPDWFRAVRDQCQAAGVPFFFKQWGEWVGQRDWGSSAYKLYGLHIWPDLTRSYWVGRKRAGRLLDVREWNELPNM